MTDDTPTKRTKEDRGPQQFYRSRDALDAFNSAAPSDSLARLGAAFSRLGRPGHAVSFYEQALVNFRDSGDRSAEAQTLMDLGQAYWHGERNEEAVRAYSQAVALYRLLEQPVNNA